MRERAAALGRSWRITLRRVHLWLGLSLGLLFVVIGLTGSALVFYVGIDEALHPLCGENGKRHFDATLEDEANWFGRALLVSDEAAVAVAKRGLELRSAALVAVRARWYDMTMRMVPFPRTPAQVRECLALAAEGAIAVERDGSPMIAIVPVEEYERLVALDRAEATAHISIP